MDKLEQMLKEYKQVIIADYANAIEEVLNATYKPNKKYKLSEVLNVLEIAKGAFK